MSYTLSRVTCSTQLAVNMANLESVRSSLFHGMAQLRCPCRRCIRDIARCAAVAAAAAARLLASRSTQQAQKQRRLQASPGQSHAVQKVGVAAAAAQPQLPSGTRQRQRSAKPQRQPGQAGRQLRRGERQQALRRSGATGAHTRGWL